MLCWCNVKALLVGARSGRYRRWGRAPNFPLAPATAAPDSQVQATLTFRGATVNLNHVLIVRYGNEEGFGGGPELRILLADREIPLSVAGLADASSTAS